MIWELDEHDLVAIDDDVEAQDDAGLVSLDDAPTSTYAPGLSDDEVDAIVAGLTRELCRPSRGRMR